MKVDKIICACALITFSIAPALSQVNKEVEVTQAFIPQVHEATKPTMVPDMRDDSYITPDIDYSITPISIHTQIDTTPYKPIEMNYWEYERQKNYYAKLGLGLPLSSVADLYASRYNSDRGYLVGYVNQWGKYADIENDLGEKNSSSQMHLKVGAGAGLFLGKKSLDGAFSYRCDKWSRYATNVVDDEHPLYQRVALKGFYGDNFSDWSRWNYSLSAGVEQMWSRSDFANMSVGVNVMAGREALGGRLKFVLGYDNIMGDADYSNVTYCGGANYGRDGVRSNFSVGLKYYNDNVSYGESNTSSYFVPQISFGYNLFEKRMITYLTLDGELSHNDFASLSELNPYLAPALFATKSSVDYRLNVGIKGCVGGDKLGYNLHLDYIISENDLYWAFVEYQISQSDADNYFDVAYSKASSLSVDFEMEYELNSKFRFDFGGRFSHYYEDDAQVWENSKPTTQIDLRAQYRWRAFAIGLGGEMLSRRLYSEIFVDEMGEQSLSVGEIPLGVNLSADVNYELKNGMVIFADVTNILNTELYEWARYREYGVGCMVGVRFEF